MKKLQRLIQSVVVLIIAAQVVHTASAIEQLKVAVKSTNAILSWPGVAGDTYIVRYRTAFTNQWTILTNAYPAASGTNRTVFTNFGAAIHVMVGTNGSGTNGSPPPLPSPVPDVPTASEITLTGGNIDNGAAHYSYWLSYLTTSGESFVSPACPAQSTQNGGTPVPNKAMHVVFPTTPAGVTNIHVWRTYVDSGHVYSTATFPTNVGLLSAVGTNNTYYNDGESTSQFAARVNHSIIPPMQTVSTNTNIFIMDAKLYQVVKSGVHLYGITNGMKLTGVVPLKVEWGNTNTNGVLSALYLSDTNHAGIVRGTSSIDPSSVTNGLLTGQWDTTALTNGSYTVQLGASLTDATTVSDHAVTVTVSNLLWFPDSWPVGGKSIFIGAQTHYTSGTWQVKAYDDTGTYIGYVTGSIDARGYLSLNGSGSAGFSINNTDGSGNQLPSTFYSLVYSADSAHPLSSTPPYTFTSKTFIEKDWNFDPTGSVLMNQQVFGANTTGTSDLAAAMAIVDPLEDYFHYMEIGDTMNGWVLGRNGPWSTVVDLGLTDPTCRDFFYFGHGSPNDLGGGGDGLLKSSDLGFYLGNTLTNGAALPNGYPFHPYRFVFLDGCNTANGTWPAAFGIPLQKNMTVADFTKRGIRPRAFMGWTSASVYQDLSTRQFDSAHETFLTTFWSTWGNTSVAVPLWQAITNANAAAFNAAPTTWGLFGGNIVVYGATNLDISQ